MLVDYKLGQGSIILRVKLRNSSVSTGAGLTGLAYNSSGLIISTIADNESSATAYTVAGSTIETISTLGTFAAPTATKCRFKEVDSTNHKGIYEIQLADARFAVSNAKSLMVSISGATNLAECDVVIPLRQFDPYDSARAGLTALPNAAAGASGGLPLSVDSSGRVDVLKVNGATQTARDIGASVLLAASQPNYAPSKAGDAMALTSDERTATAAVVRDIDNTEPAANSLGSDIKSIKINGVPVTGTNTLTQTQISSAVWAKDTSLLTTSGSIGKRLLDLFSGITSIAQWLGLIAGKQTGDSTALAEIRATGVGSGGFSPTSDSLEAHRDHIDALIGTPADTNLSTDIANIAADVLALDVGAGSGVHHVTITFTSGGDPFEGATVTTLLGGVLKANALSGSDGVADNYLNDGTYTLNYAAEGHLGGTTTFAVSADGQNKNISLTLLAITPSDPGFTTGYLVAYTDGAEAENVKHTRKLLKLPSGSTGLSLNAGEKTAYSNSSGIVQFTNHIPGATYEVRREDVQGGGFHYVAGDTDGFEIISCYG